MRDSLGPGVEGRWHFLGRYFPPARNDTPAHRDKLRVGFCRSHNIDRRCRGDVVAGPQVSSRLKLNQFAPRVALGEVSAQSVSLSLMGDRENIHRADKWSFGIVIACRSSEPRGRLGDRAPGIWTFNRDHREGRLWGLPHLKGVACHDYPAQCFYSRSHHNIYSNRRLGFLLRPSQKLSTLCGEDFYTAGSVYCLSARSFSFSRDMMVPCSETEF